MADVGSANIRITADDSQARKQVGGFFGFLKKSAGTAAGLVGGLAIFDQIKSGMAAAYEGTIGANASMEQYQNTLTQVLGSSKKAVETLAWAKDFAAQTPFEIPDIVEATTALSAYGLNAQEVLGVTGDMAATMGKPLMQAVEAIADAQTGELERLKEFGITKDMLIKKSAEMGQGEIVNAKGQITNMEGLNAALFALMNDRFEGGMAIQSKSFNGMISNLKDSVSQTAVILSQPLFEKFKEGLQSILPVMQSVTEMVAGNATEANAILVEAYGSEKAAQIQSFFNTLVEGFKSGRDWLLEFIPTLKNLKDILEIVMPVIALFGKGAAGAVGGIMDVLPDATAGITDMLEGFLGMEAVVPILAGVQVAMVAYQYTTQAVTWAQKAWTAAVALHNTLMRAYTAYTIAAAVAGGGLRGAIAGVRAAFLILNTTMAANPIAIVIAVIAGLVAAFIVAYQTSEKFRNIVNGAWKSIKENFHIQMDAIMRDWDTMSVWFGQVGDRFKQEGEQIKQDWASMKDYFSTVKDRFNKDINEMKLAWSTLKNLPDTMGPKIDQWRETSRLKMEGWKLEFLLWFDRMRDELPGKLEQWGLKIKGWLEAQNVENKRQFGIWGTAILNWFTSMPGKMGTSISNWWTPIGEWFSSLPGRTSKKLGEWWNSISNWAVGKYESWKTALGRWGDAISEWFTSLPQRTRTKLGEWWNSISSWISSKYTSWKTSLGSWWTGIYEWFTSLPGRSRTQLGNWWSSISGWVSNTAKNWRTSLENWWKEIKNWFTSLANKPEIKNSGKDMIKKVAGGTEEEKKTLFDKLGKIVVNAILFMLGATLVIALAAGREIIKRIITGIQFMKGALGTKWEEIKTQAKSKMSEMISSVVEKAKGLPGAIGKGITNKIKDATGAMTKLANSLVTKFKDALHISSPSGVFYDMAHWIIQGLINGLTAGNLGKLGTDIFKDFAGGAFKTINSIKGFLSGGFDVGANISGGASAWKNMITAAARQMGEALSPSELKGIIAQISRESSGNQRITQSPDVVDVNTLNNNPARGLLQYITGTFKSYAVKGFNNIYSGFDQLLAFFNNRNWRRDLPYGRRGWGPTGARKFAKGGFFLDGPQMGLFGEGGPEMALPLIGKNMLPYSQAVAQNLANMIGGSRPTADGSQPGPYIFQVNLNGRIVAEETYEDIKDLQNRAEARTRRARGEVI